MAAKPFAHYLIQVYGGTQPFTHGPYKNVWTRETRAKRMFREEIKDEDSLFWLDVLEDGHISIGSFSNAFAEEARGAS
jgi:hypothetical protein